MLMPFSKHLVLHHAAAVSQREVSQSLRFYTLVRVCQMWMP